MNPKLRLPKDVVADPRHESILSRLSEGASPLWAQGTEPVPRIPLAPALRSELGLAMTSGHAVQGLEQITQELQSEQRGLDALKTKTPTSPQGERISRLLLVSNDGSERFYRDCDQLQYHYRGRLLTCRIEATGEDLGSALFGGRSKLVRAVLVADKKAVARILLTLG